MSTMYSIGAINQLADAFENAGLTSDDLTKLRQFKDLAKLKDVITGEAVIKYPEHLIDCNADPFIPCSWELESHKKGGMFEFNKEKFFLYLTKKQKKRSIEGNELRKELLGKPVMNANVLDYLLAHPKLIPEEWESKYIFFWGTIYRNSNGLLYVRYLRWDGSQWGWRCHWLDDDFAPGYVAVLASWS